MRILPRRNSAFSPSGAELTATDMQTSGSVTKKTHTFSSVDFGAADPGRVAYVAIAVDRGGSGLTPDSVTIGGVSATQVGTTVTSPGNGEAAVSLWKLSLATGTTASVAVDYS